MPVTIIPAAHQPKIHPGLPPAKSLDQFLYLAGGGTCLREKSHVVASSFSDEQVTSDVVHASSSSFICSVIEAWGRHAHLVLRPEDFWFTILTQLGYYLQRNAPSCEHLLAIHDGRNAIDVEGVDVECGLTSIRGLLQDKFRRPWVSDWVSPGFSTSTEDDELTAIVLIMGCTKDINPFSEAQFICGIPSITLLGTKEDWLRLESKVNSLKDFGTVPEDYARRLRPIITRVISTFNGPITTELETFWDQILQAKVRHCGQNKKEGCPAGQYVINGWILGLFYWNDLGQVDTDFSHGLGKRQSHGILEYDGIQYGQAPLEDIPMGFSRILFRKKNHQNGEDKSLLWLLAGNIGMKVTNGAPEGFKHIADTNNIGEKLKSAHIKKQREHGCEDYVSDKAVEDTMHGNGAGCLSGISRRFTHLKRKCLKLQDKKPACPVKIELATSIAKEGHSTVQPMSGWFAFGPEETYEPIMKEKQICGPTVNAINACKNVKHEISMDNYQLSHPPAVPCLQHFQTCKP